MLENQKRKQKLLWRCSDRGNGDVYESLCEIEHPNLRPVYDVCSEGNEVEVLEEYLEGEPLSDLLQQHTMKKADVKRVMIGLCRALEALHGLSIVHRDIKPENVLIGENGQVWLIDYDAARVMDGKRTGDPGVGNTGVCGAGTVRRYSVRKYRRYFCHGCTTEYDVVRRTSGTENVPRMGRAHCAQMYPYGTEKRYRSAARLQRACKLLSGRK